MAGSPYLRPWSTSQQPFPELSTNVTNGWQLAANSHTGSQIASSGLLLSLQQAPILYILTITAGALSHSIFFIHGEWHVQAPQLFVVLLLNMAATTVLQLIHGETIVASLQTTILLTAAYFLGTMSSMTIYRRFFHRLRHFDGPLLASVTKFWHVFQCLDSKNYLVLDKLYKQYGPFVRTGPSEVTCFLPDIVPMIDGPGSLCDKAPWYDLLLPELAVNTTRDRATHDKRRRIWDRGFTNKALGEYQKRIETYAHALENHVEKASATTMPIDVSVLFYWFTFDVMGEFAFGKSFSMLENERWHFAVVLLRKAMRLLGPLTPVPWLAQIAIMKMPWIGVIKDWLMMLEWCRERMRERMKNGSDRPDVSQYLIEASEKSNTVEQDLPWLYGDAVTIIIAGSDTAAPTLVYTFLELAKDRTHSERIRAEIKDIDIYDYRALEQCDYLNGVLNEVLRLHHPVPTHGYRMTPPQGITVDGTFIPGGTTIVAPRYTLGRLESCFSQPDAFIPERWSTRPDLVKDARAFRPFGSGRYGCVGKNLALRELRFVIALLVKGYDVVFAPGEDGVTVVEEKRDYFTAAPGSLKLNFVKVDA